LALDHGWDIDLAMTAIQLPHINKYFSNGGLKNREGYNRIVRK